MNRGPAALRRAIIGLLTALCPVGQSAFACPTPEEPCAVEGGFYHARTPEGAARGLVLYLHGWGGVGRLALADDALVAPFLETGYAVIAPQGSPRRPGDRGGAWNAMAGPARRDDVAFLQAVLADARERLDLADAPTLAAGFSGGGMMVWRLACDAPGSADAYAPIAGLLWRPLPERCAGPARLLHVHGWSDAVVPLEGRSVAGGSLVQGDLFAGLTLLRRSFGCAADEPDSLSARGALWLRLWRCGDGGALALALHRGGHARPPGWPRLALDWLEGAIR